MSFPHEDLTHESPEGKKQSIQNEIRVNRIAQRAMFSKRQLGLCCDKNDVIVLNDEDGVKHKIILCKKADSTIELADILLNETVWPTCDVIDSAQKSLKATSQFSLLQ